MVKQANQRSHSYGAILASSLRAQWQLDDIIAENERLDFSRNFLPEGLARTASTPGLSEPERRTLNHIAAYQYVRQFEVVETFILPFINHHIENSKDCDSPREEALANFLEEEKKHIAMFQRFRRSFETQSGITCLTLDSSRIAEKINLHDPLAVGLIVLMFEWATQAHYIDSIRGDQDIDPVFKRLFKFHWIEESQHAKLDTLLIEDLGRNRTPVQINRAVAEAIAIGVTIGRNCLKQAELNIFSLERTLKRSLPNREQLIRTQFGAGRNILLASGLRHRRFQNTLRCLSPEGLVRVNQLAFAAKQA